MRADRVCGCRWVLIIVVLAVGADLISKRVAEQELSGRPRRSLAADFVRLEYRENVAGFWGMGASLQEPVRNAVFDIGITILVAGMGVLLGWLTHAGRPNLGMTLLFAGGLANQISRLSRGSVIDFVNIGVGWLRTRTFNLADVVLLCGALIIAAASYKRRALTREDRSRPTSG